MKCLKKPNLCTLFVVVILTILFITSCKNEQPPSYYKPGEGVFETGIYELSESADESCKTYEIFEMETKELICVLPKQYIGIDDVEKFETVSVESKGITEYERWLAIKLNEIGRTKFEEFTTKNLGKRIAFIINDRIVLAPLIQEKISSGNIVTLERHKQTKLSISELIDILEYEQSQLE